MSSAMRLKKAAASEVEDHVPGFEDLDVPHEFELLVVVQVGDKKGVLGAADEAEALERRPKDGVIEGGEPAGEKVPDIRVGVVHAEKGVEVGGPEVDVYEDGVMSQPGRRETEARSDETFPRSSCASSDGPLVLSMIMVEEIE